MTWVLLAVAVIVVWWLLDPGEPQPNELEHPAALGLVFRYLMNRGLHRPGVRGRVVVCLRNDPEQRLIFWKYIRGTGELGFEAEFPLTPASAEAYHAFRTELLRRGVPHEELPLEAGPVLKFDFGRDVGLGHVVTHVFFEDVLRLRVARDCVAFFHDCLVTDAPRLTGVDKDNAV